MKGTAGWWRMSLRQNVIAFGHIHKHTRDLPLPQLKDIKKKKKKSVRYFMIFIIIKYFRFYHIFRISIPIK